MAEYFTRSSSGTKASTASISELLPAADDDCTTTASGFVQLARDRRQIAHELVGLLADHAAALEVSEDAVEQLRIAQQCQRRRSLFVAHRRLLLAFGASAFWICSSLQFLQLQQHLAEVALTRLLP